MIEAKNTIQEMELPPEAESIFQELIQGETGSGSGFLILEPLLNRQGISIQSLYLILRGFMALKLLESWCIQQRGSAVTLVYTLATTAIPS